MFDNYDYIPQELKENGKWVVLDNKQDPYDPKTENLAKLNDVTTFADYNTAYNLFGYNNKYNGIGIGLFYNIYVVKIDHCFIDNMLSEQVQEIVDLFASYTEISANDEDILIVGYFSNFEFDMKKYCLKNDEQHIELYFAGLSEAYIKVTGNIYRYNELKTCDNKTMKKFLDTYMVNTFSYKPKLISAEDLYTAEFEPLKYYVEDILPEGTTILSAAPKSGKSWFVLDLALKIASSDMFLDKKTTKTGVLYLALEDSERRLQDRINIIQQNRKIPNGVYFLTEIPSLDNNFIESVNSVLKEHSDIKLIIIDTLQKIRGQALPRETPYQYDYRETGLLKKYADKKGISLLIVHHNRKMKDTADPFNMISGTNGIMGAADTIIVMTKSQRDDEETNLHITGRDVEGSSIVIRFDKDTCTWLNLGDLKELQEKEEREYFNSNNIVVTIIKLLHQSNNGEWQGKATDIKKEGEKLHLNMPDVQKIGYEIPKLKSGFKKFHNIEYIPIHKGNSGTIHNFHMG